MYTYISGIDAYIILRPHRVSSGTTEHATAATKLQQSCNSSSVLTVSGGLYRIVGGLCVCVCVCVCVIIWEDYAFLSAILQLCCSSVAALLQLFLVAAVPGTAETELHQRIGNSCNRVATENR